MNSIHAIKTIAHFEMKTLFRSWFFRIFAGLFIIGLGIFNVAVFVESSGAPFIFRTLPASIPYANLLILNLGQAIVAIFLASEFLKQDQKNDTVEVVYARPVSNTQYVTGKALGVLIVFLVLNLILLIMGIGFSFIAGDSAKGIGEFFLYPVIISIPTLVFILGLSFFLMSTLKNQAITFIILLGYIALTIFYLDEKYYHIFDYIGYKTPMMNSIFGGFGNLFEIILLRGIYFFTGIGLIFLTVFRLNRLPQTKKINIIPLITGLLFLFAGYLSGYSYIQIKKDSIKQKQELIALNNQYINHPRVYITQNKISLEHLGKNIKVQSEINITNNSKTAIDTLIFSLNPSLNIQNISINNQETAFDRNLHLVLIPYPQKLKKGENKKITFEYTGKINENTHFLDKDPEQFKYTAKLDLYKARKRFAYIEKDFVCLTSESLWYPVAGVTYSSLKPAYHLPDFTLFNLKVKTSGNLTALSQGESKQTEKGIFEFNNPAPLPKISLTIANYNKYAIEVDSVEYAIYTSKGNEYYLEHFAEFKDTLPAIIRELRDEYENLVGLKYGFKRFILAEVPVHFALDKHIWSVTSDAVQPEIILYQERGVILEETDFKKRKKRYEKRMEDNNEEVTPEELQCRMFKRFVRGNFMAPPTEWYMFDDIMDKYTYSIIPQYYTFLTQLKSEEWPALNTALEVYLRERNVGNVSSFRWNFRGINKGEKINLELQESNLAHLLKNGIDRDKYKENDEDDALTLNEILLAKGNQLFSLFRARYNNKEFDQLLNNMVEKYKHQSFTVNNLENEILNQFNDSITTNINNWYTKKQLPGFLIKDLETYKVMDNEHTKYQVKLKIANPEPVDGIVVINIDLDDKSNNQQFNQDGFEQPDYTKNIFLHAKSAKEIGIIFNTEPARMNIFTNISKNLPNNLIYDFSGFEETRKTKAIDEIKNHPLFDHIANNNEIIVDNEDDNFQYIQETYESYLKKLINQNKKEKYKYTGIRFWNPPSEWKLVLQSGFYGKYIHSGLYTRAGEGERKAQWNAPIKESGYYDIYCNIYKFEVEWHQEKRKPNYNFTIYHDDGADNITLSDEELEEGWNYMGTFYISPGNAKVELSNKSVGKMVFADAIKWVKNK